MDKPTESTKIIANESFKPFGKFKTKQALILSSSDESQTMANSDIFVVRFLLEFIVYHLSVVH